MTKFGLRFLSFRIMMSMELILGKFGIGVGREGFKSANCGAKKSAFVLRLSNLTCPCPSIDFVSRHVAVGTIPTPNLHLRIDDRNYVRVLLSVLR